MEITKRFAFLFFFSGMFCSGDVFSERCRTAAGLVINESSAGEEPSTATAISLLSGATGTATVLEEQRCPLEQEQQSAAADDVLLHLPLGGEQQIDQQQQQHTT